MFLVDIEAVAVWRTLTRRIHECMGTEYMGTCVQGTEYMGTCVQGT